MYITLGVNLQPKICCDIYSIFPAYSTNIVIVIFNKWPRLLSDLSHPFAAHGLPFLLFLPMLTSGHP